MSADLFFDVLQLLLQFLHVGHGGRCRRGRSRSGRGRGRGGEARAVVHVVRSGLRRHGLSLVHLHLRQVTAALLLHCGKATAIIRTTLQIELIGFECYDYGTEQHERYIDQHTT